MFAKMYKKEKLCLFQTHYLQVIQKTVPSSSINRTEENENKIALIIM